MSQIIYNMSQACISTCKSYIIDYEYYLHYEYMKILMVALFMLIIYIFEDSIGIINRIEGDKKTKEFIIKLISLFPYGIFFLISAFIYLNQK